MFGQAAGSFMRNLRWQLRSSSLAAANLVRAVVTNSGPLPKNLNKSL